MSADREPLRTVLSRALCVKEDNLEVFGELVRRYGLPEQQEALVRMLAATLATLASEDDLRDFGLHLAGKP